MTIDEMIEVLEAYKAGKEIQAWCGEGWKDCPTPNWVFNAIKYRVKPKKLVTYVNGYLNGAMTYPTRAMADAAAGKNSNRISCVRVEYEEGQFDE